MEALDRTEMASQYKGQWVALSSDRTTVVGAGRSAQTALEAAKEKGFAQPVLTRMPAVIRSFVGPSPRE